MTDRPIIFSAPMIAALLAGTKTQTRRILKPQPREFVCDGWKYWNASGAVGGRICTSDEELLELHGYAVGDRLWVREAWANITDLVHADCGTQALADGCFYRADDGTAESEIPHWRSPIHMPRRASRITLTVTDVRAQRLQDISEDDARAEGATPQEDAIAKFGYPQTFRAAFADLWEGIHGPGAWNASPWVAALSFTVARGNIDALELAPGAQT